MYKKSTLYALAGFLLAEAITIVALPARIPRAVRAITAGINLVAAIAVVVIARRQR